MWYSTNVLSSNKVIIFFEEKISNDKEEKIIIFYVCLKILFERFSNIQIKTKQKTLCYTGFSVQSYYTRIESLRRVLFYIQAFEKQFVQEQLDKSSEEQKKELVKRWRKLAKSKKRIAELDVLFQRIYDNNITGKLSDERFAIMSANYETEQKTLK